VLGETEGEGVVRIRGFLPQAVPVTIRGASSVLRKREASKKGEKKFNRLYQEKKRKVGGGESIT